MRFLSNVENRKQLVLKLSQLTGEVPKYAGVPSCAYIVGQYVLTKENELLVDEPDDEVVAALVADGSITPFAGEENDSEEECESASEENAAEESTVEATEETTEEEAIEPDTLAVELTFPLIGHTAGSLKNLINQIYSRGPLISKAIGGSFSVEKSLIESKDLEVSTIVEFTDALAEHADEYSGFYIDDQSIHFTGFGPMQDTEHLDAFTRLFAALNKSVQKQRRTQAKEADLSNEKFAFRTWMIRLGMDGPDFKLARKILMEKLDGNSAFRDQASEDRWKERQAELKAQRAAAKA